MLIFLIIIVVFFAQFLRNRRVAGRDPELEPLWWGLHAGILGALVGGIFDHYFFNLDFHHSVTLFWLVVGLATAATRIIARRVAQQPDNPIADGAQGAWSLEKGKDATGSYL